MAAELWVVECGGEISEPVRRDVMDWLAGFDVEALTFSESLEQIRDADFCLVPPIAIVGLIHSLEADRQALFERSACLASVAACVMLDVSFDERLGSELLRAGTQDYLDVTRLDADELTRRIEYAVIRSEPRESAIAGPALNDVEWQRVNDVYRGLPQRERQVLDLLIAMRDPKQIARELGTEYTTVRTQTKSLRDKFGVESTQQLVVLMMHALYHRPSASQE